MITENIIWLFERDLNKIKEELLLYKNENDIWKLEKDIKNSAGTLTHHLTGSLKHFIGANLGNTGYKREREKEFADRSISLAELLKGIDEVISIVKTSLLNVSDEQLKTNFPIEFIGKTRLNIEVIMLMYGHVNYHLGQINYHRRLLTF